MKVVTIPYDQISPMWQGHVDEGYEWGCECGESYTTQIGAEHCRKCRQYLDHIPSKVFHTPKPAGAEEQSNDV